jgi:hypothetical protein
MHHEKLLADVILSRQAKELLRYRLCVNRKMRALIELRLLSQNNEPAEKFPKFLARNWKGHDLKSGKFNPG